MLDLLRRIPSTPAISDSTDAHTAESVPQIRWLKIKSANHPWQLGVSKSTNHQGEACVQSQQSRLHTLIQCTERQYIECVKTRVVVIPLIKRDDAAYIQRVFPL